MRAFVLSSLLLLAACTADKDTPGDDSGTPSTPEATWAVAFDVPAGVDLSGIWGSADDDVFAVGGTPDDGRVFHFDGTDWAEMTVPEAATMLVWVFGFGPSDVWACGEDGTVIRYDGSAWSMVETPTEAPLWGVWGRANDDLWFAGGEVSGDGPPFLMHYNGSAFEQFDVAPEQNDRQAKALFKVFGAGDRTFAVGQKGLIIEYESGTWQQRATGAQADDDFVSLWGTSADNIVTVGGRNTARISHFDGSGWTTIAPTGVPGLNAVSMVDENTAVIAGITGFGGSYDVATGTVTTESLPQTSVDLHAAWTDSSGATYVVGGRFYEPHEGALLKRTVED